MDLAARPWLATRESRSRCRFGRLRRTGYVGRRAADLRGRRAGLRRRTRRSRRARRACVRSRFRVVAGGRRGEPRPGEPARAAAGARAPRRRSRARRARQPRSVAAARRVRPARPRAPTTPSRTCSKPPTPIRGSTGCAAGRSSRRGSSAPSASRWCTRRWRRTGRSTSSIARASRRGTAARIAARSQSACSPHDPEDDPDADALARLTRARSVDAARSLVESRTGATRGTPGTDAGPRSDPDYGVVYGHWATQGLHVAPMLRGLDTGCVYHGTYGDRFLTAWLPSQMTTRRRSQFPTTASGASQRRGRARRGRAAGTGEIST